jgi:DNA mismatch endonuclease (patch repair protein)
MMDSITVQKRSANMRAIRSKNTSPEIFVRHTIYHLGYRYILHAKNLPGKPDIVFRSRHKVIFVHGCFWHQHQKSSCLDSHVPHTNEKYWKEKLERNVERDKNNIRDLKINGWNVLIIWECETKYPGNVTSKLVAFLQSQS